MDLERHLSRSIYVIKKFKLNERRNLAVLSRLVESLELDRNQVNKYFHKIRTLKFKGEKIMFDVIFDELIKEDKLGRNLEN